MKKVQNLKVDIIYHQSPSDFEMEFNMCGCCHMRLLSDKTTDKKGFIKALSRDVARSRVIIGCGPLFGEDGIINMVAKAISAGLAVCNNKTYGINSEEQIHIINGSTPLVTPDGYFGGCIIESGPQTIILLTENKTFRKAIMQNLIHPYMVDISYISNQNTPIVHQEPVYETALSDNEVYLTQPDDNYEEETLETPEPLPAIAEDEHNIDFVMDGEEDNKEDEPTVAEEMSETVYDNMYIEIETQDDIKSRYENPYTPSQSDNMFLSTPEQEELLDQDLKVKTRAMDITIVILVLLLLLAVLTLIYFVVLRPMTMGVSTVEYIKEIFGIASSSTIV